jgi:hypothetical protein
MSEIKCYSFLLVFLEINCFIVSWQWLSLQQIDIPTSLIWSYVKSWLLNQLMVRILWLGSEHLKLFFKNLFYLLVILKIIIFTVLLNSVLIIIILLKFKSFIFIVMYKLKQNMIIFRIRSIQFEWVNWFAMEERSFKKLIWFDFW